MYLKMILEETTSVGPGAKYKRRIPYEPSADDVYWIRNNMAQWYQICTDFSSADPHKQQAAYTILLDLNIRYTNEIPSGMKCTLNFLKARLQDKMFAAQIFEKQLDDDVEILRGRYISAIQDFIDILGKTNDLSIGIYPLSGKLELPDWLSDIYNEICQSKKPIIEKLRAAVHQCIDWLRDKYWMQQSKMASTWMQMEIKVKDDIREVVTALDKYLGHYFKGNSLMCSIPDENLRRHVAKRSNVYDFPELHNMKQKLINKKLLVAKDISLSIIVLVKDITEYLKQDIGMHIVENLAEVLLDGNCFLPSQELLYTLDPERYVIDHGLPFHFLKIWNGIFEFLPQIRFIPALFDKLLELTNNEKESEERQGMAAIWIKVLADSLRAVRKLVENKLVSGKQDQVNAEIAFDWKLMQKVADDGNMIRLKLQEVPIQLQQSINFRRLLPQLQNKWTSVYIQSLIFLQEPRLPKGVEDMIFGFVGNSTDYNKYMDTEGNFPSKDIAIHSAEELEALWIQLSKFADKDDGVNYHHGIPWVHNVEKWGSNPLHHQLKILTDDLPGASLWRAELQE